MVTEVRMTDKPQVLYRMFDADGNLLYVGLTNNPRSRFSDHCKTKSWFDQVSNIKVQTFQSRRDLLDAERTAIETEVPLHNVTHNEVRAEIRFGVQFEADEDEDDRLAVAAFAKLEIDKRQGATTDELAELYIEYLNADHIRRPA
jgi:predicted GIY-YIG superfamily endonuclease